MEVAFCESPVREREAVEMRDREVDRMNGNSVRWRNAICFSIKFRLLSGEMAVCDLTCFELEKGNES